MTTETRTFTEEELTATTARFAELGSTDPEDTARKYLSVDWEQISRDNKLDSIGAELYRTARALEDIGYEKTVAVLAGIMDGFRCNNPVTSGLTGHETRTIAHGFAAAMVRQAANEVDDEEEE